MVFLSRKKPPPPPSSSSAAPSLKIPQPQKESVEPDAVEKMTAILAEVGCTLMNPYGPPCLPSDLHAFRRNLTGRLSSFSANSGERDNVGALCSVFVAGFSLYIQSPSNLRRMLSSSSTTKRDESLVRNLLLVSPIQLDIQEMLLEKLPEYFDVVTGCSLEEDVARLIINHFRWLDFIVNPHVFTDKLMQVLSICPLHLKKEIIGSLPEIIGDHNCQAVVDSLEKMLQEDSAVVVAVLDSFSNLNLDDQLQEQAITVAISCIRTIDGEHMPYLLRFLLLAATPVNVRRIISQIREQLKFTGMSQPCASQNKLKGKVPAYNAEGSILHALRSSLRFKNILCQEIIKELNSLEKPRDFKVIDVWLLILMYMNGDPVRKSIEKIFKKKVVDECIQEALLDQCIGGNKEFVKILGALVTHVGSDNKFEVSSVLEMMTALVKKYAQQLLPFSSHINGISGTCILDYLEGFTIDNLHKTYSQVYEVFSLLALSARASGDSFRSSISNELMMIVRKQLTPSCLVLYWQVSHPDLKYKKMGLVGSLRIVSSLGDAKSVPDFSSSQVERLTNDGSLAGVDALLGCPLHLPSSKLVGSLWQRSRKKSSPSRYIMLQTGYENSLVTLPCIFCDLLNAFSSQIDEKIGCISQATVKDVTTKLLKRLRNLVFLESLLSNLITLSPQSLPELHPYSESHVEHPRKKNEKRKLDDDASQRKVSMKNNLKKSKHSDVNEKLRQPTIMDAFKKAGAVMSHSQTQLRGTPSLPSMDGSTAAGSMDENCSDNESLIVKIPQVSSALEAQRFKFRPLLPQCLSILNFPKVLSQDMGSPEYRAELPLYLYLLHDLHTKLDCLVPPGKQHPFKRGSAPGYFGRFKLVELLNQIKRLFPSLRIHLNIAISLLIRGDETSQTTWRDEFALSGNPNTSSIVVSESLVYTMVCKEVLYCFSKILTLPEFETDKSLLLNLLEAFQPTEIPVANFPDFQPFPSPGTKEYLYIGVSYFFEDILNKGNYFCSFTDDFPYPCSFSFDLAFECLLTLQLVVTSVQKYLGKVSEEANRKRNPGHFHGLVPNLHAKLGTSAEKLLRHKWVDESTDNKGLKNKVCPFVSNLRIVQFTGEMVQTILRIYLEASGSTSDLLDELACTILPQASLSKSTGEDDDARDHEFPTLCAATFRGWYKTLLEENLAILNKLVKTVSSEKRQNCQPKTTEAHLKNIQKTVNVVVSLVNLCRSHEKVTIHGMAIKYGGKYVDSFLKGSLKHKDLRGQIVSSQAYIDNEADEVEETMSGEEEPMQEDELPLTP
ncbi:hypothetical [Arabidopsis thaliana]|uniref:Fanconi anemia group D2 protein n=1 Tax=Arabidopsis thaliana TaxID=3702 RepID=O23351_ARATH|nr:hypothetical [Arabidopsis thaliana]CAB78539.1 hypothetical [Arabidopsis thaliana]